MNKLERQKQHFNKIAEEYFMTRRGEKQVLLHKLLYNELFYGVTLNNRERIKVLEPMCGFGEGKMIIQEHLNKNIEYEGFDYSEKIVKYAKQIDSEINIYVQDVTTYKSNNKYDVIIIVGGLHHVPDYAEQVLMNCYSMLEDNGILINIEPTYNNYFYKKICEFIYKKNPVFDEKTERRFSLKELNWLYEKSGLEIVKQIYPGLFAYLLWYNPDAFPWLNKGRTSTVEKIFQFDKHFMYNRLGKKISVATFTILKRRTV